MPIDFKKCNAIRILAQKTTSILEESRRKLEENQVRAGKLLARLHTKVDTPDFAKNILTELRALLAGGLELGTHAYSLHTIAFNKAGDAEKLQQIPSTISGEFAGMDPRVSTAAVAALWAACDAAFDFYQRVVGPYRSNMESTISKAIALADDIAFYNEHVRMVEAWAL
jgi:hypothetical protein